MSTNKDNKPNANGDIFPSHQNVVFTLERVNGEEVVEVLNATLTDWKIHQHRDVERVGDALKAGEVTLTLKGVVVNYD